VGEGAEMKICLNCNYWDLKVTQKPCSACIDLGAWEPKDAGPKFIKRCITCKHEWDSLRTGPCNLCPGYAKWEPIEDPKVKGDIATANLIAAAPELLICCRNALALLKVIAFSTGESSTITIKELKAVIAKAKGGN